MENPWDGYDALRQDPPKRIRGAGRDQDKWICPEHGPICRSGICAACTRIERDMRWKEEKEDREERIRKWKAQTEKATLKRARGKMVIPRAAKPHLATSPQVSRMDREGGGTGEEAIAAGATMAAVGPMVTIHALRCVPY